MDSTLFSDIDFNFTPHPVTGDIVTIKDNNAIRRSIYNLVNIAFYEKKFHPEIGSNLGRLLFETQSPLLKANLISSIKTVLNNYEPRIDIGKIDVVFINNDAEITINYKIIGTLTPLSVTLTIRRTR